MLRLRMCQMLQGKYSQLRSSSPKSIQLQEGDSSKTAVIGAGLDEK
jgi:hypothetical protein